jgi:hypothetical protein
MTAALAIQRFLRPIEKEMVFGQVATGHIDCADDS